MVYVYVLINTEKGKALDAVDRLLKIKGAYSACVVTGQYDVIAIFEVGDVADIGELVCKKIQGLGEVAYTQTAVCVTCLKA